MISIEDYAFYYCVGLTSVTIADSVISVGYQAFANCTNLLAINVDVANTFYSSLDGVLFNRNQTTLIQFPQGKALSYVIPGSVTSIGNYAFFSCDNLTGVTIPSSVTSIGDQAFQCCTRLTSVTIPGSITSIGSLAFYYCTNLVSVTIPGSVTNIGDSAFSECQALRNVTIFNGVTSIPVGAFFQCISLTNLTIPASITSIGDWAFGYCISLTNVTISGGLTNIGTYAFYICNSLTRVFFKGNAPSFGPFAFDGDASATVYYLPVRPAGAQCTVASRQASGIPLHKPAVSASALGQGDLVSISPAHRTSPSWWNPAPTWAAQIGLRCGASI